MSPASLTFAAATWSTPHTVTITGVNDYFVDGNVAYTILPTAASSDANYSGLAISDVSVTNTGCTGAVGQQGYPGCFGNTSVSHSQTNWQAMYSHRF